MSGRVPLQDVVTGSCGETDKKEQTLSLGATITCLPNWGHLLTAIADEEVEEVEFGAEEFPFHYLFAIKP